MLLRDRILEAAVRVYGAHGFRGATTRRIAEAAGVNEVTLFRTFGSKAALIDAAIRNRTAREDAQHLPAVPGDVVAELTAWAGSIHGHMRRMRSMIRKCMSEMEERPEMSGAACEGPTWAHKELRDYLHRVQEAGLASRDVDPMIAASMLMSSLFADAMGRDMMPSIYPPASSAAEQYVRVIARALGITVTPRATKRPGASRAASAPAS
ncbi:MAG: TetR/AcrR family transcriptional regulator [Gemmatimonadetes bacterium]|nr:TetR/AcrR family transcriptional regulator [Gemmatimonadota bacterium]